MDIVDSKKRSEMMSNIRSKDTKPEMMLRRALHAEGFRYRLHDRTLPGCPDLILAKYRVAVFVHGCFWHRHRGCTKAYLPKSNAERWAAKFRNNVDRDARAVQLLQDQGWRVITIWECALTAKELSAVIAWTADAIVESRVNSLEWPPSVRPPLDRT